MVTKNDLYAQLIFMGINKGYKVIPEFRVFFEDGHQRKDKKKDIDLVWAVRKPDMGEFQDRRNLEYWTLHATFEIEACDVRNIPGKEFNRHICDLPNLQNFEPATPIGHFIALYTSAHDRNWNHKRNVDRDIKKRRNWSKDSEVVVLDGRDLTIVEGLPNATDG